MAYAFDGWDMIRRVPGVIDQILRGTKPGDIPFYQASKFELDINLKTAKTLGIVIPGSLLARADGYRMNRRTGLAVDPIFVLAADQFRFASMLDTLGFQVLG
jgi:hypothetical protein